MALWSRIIKNPDDSRCKYWANRSPVHWFALTAHSFTPEFMGKSIIRWQFLLSFLLFLTIVNCKFSLSKVQSRNLGLRFANIRSAF